MKISRQARDKYKIESELITEKGNMEFQGNVHLVRQFVEKINQKRDLLNYPELSVKSSEIYGLSLITEINDFVLDLYQDEINTPNLNQQLYTYLEKEVGPDQLKETTKQLIEEFPPESVYRNKKSIDDFLNSKSEDFQPPIAFVDEFINLWLSNSNPAFSTYSEFFNDANLEKKATYRAVIKNIQEFFDSKPKFQKSGKNILDTLQEPYKKFPHSLKDQLKYIQENWGGFLGKWVYLILTGLDLIKEEEKMRFMGPGEIQVPDFYGLDVENYSKDSDWMPNVIMMAKNSYVWMDQLSKKYKYQINRLDQIPDEELDQLAEWGFTALWLIGLWERSPASKTIKKWCGNEDAVASAYSLYDYVIAQDLGGEESFNNLKKRAIQRGIRIASDMVPNHTGIDSKWMREHPDWYISLPYPPFPSYQYSGQSLSHDSRMGIYLEDKYFTRQDAAVTFKYVNINSGETRYIYHGNDGTSMPWNDTAQLNYLIPEVREAVIQTIIHVARLSPIIRFDAAMTLTRMHYQRLWFPEPGSGGDIPSRAGLGLTKEEFAKLMPEEFWREVVERVKQEVPDTLLLAEAFWMLEGFFVRSLGMHRVYNSIFMNALRDEDNALYRTSIKKTLEFDKRMLKRFVNFMNNPDEETAANQFGDGDKYFGVFLLLITMPGLPMIGHGQIEGFREKYGMEFRRAYWDEKVNEGLLHHFERTISQIMKKRYIFANSDYFYLFDFWCDGHVNEDVFVFSNRFGNERTLVIYNNRYNETSGYIKTSVGYNEEGSIVQKDIADALDIPEEGYSIVKDYMNGLEFLLLNKDFHDHGHYVELHGYQGICLLDWRIQPDNEYFHYAQLYRYLNGKGVSSIQHSLKELIFQPILEPFREIFNSIIINEIFTLQENSQTITKEYIQSIREKFHVFFNKIREFLALENDLSPIFDELDSEISVIINLQSSLINLSLNEQNRKYLESLLPQSKLEWSVAYAWVILHLIGKIKTNQGFEDYSRGWMEEWRLTNIIEWVLGEINKTDEKIWESVFKVKLLTTFQSWYKNSFTSGSNKSSDILKALFMKSEIQSFLHFNRYQEKLWLNAERFDDLCKWLVFTASISLIAQKQSAQLDSILTMVQNWQRVAKQAKYQVNEILTILQTM